MKKPKQPEIVPAIDCPACRAHMAYTPWKEQPGGRYICECGYQFWVIQGEMCKGLTPEFRSVRERNRRVPPKYLPDDLNYRLIVMREWQAGMRTLAHPITQGAGNE